MSDFSTLVGPSVVLCCDLFFLFMGWEWILVFGYEMVHWRRVLV